MADPKSAPPPPPSPYANFMAVTHTGREFFFSFAQMAPESQGVAQLVSRVITSPGHAKSMLRVLEDNIRQYEQRFGEIPESPSIPPQKVQ
jgi:hypothetical protein